MRMRSIAVALLSVSFAVTAAAQEPPKKDGKPAPGKPPAARPAPPPQAARPAPPPQAARPAPPPARPAPAVARPAAPPPPRMAAPPRPAPNIARPAPSQTPPAPAVSRSAPPTPAAQVAAPGAKVIQVPPQTQQDIRQQRVDERRMLRGVPPAQRAQRLEEFRAQRAVQRQQVTPNAVAPNAVSAAPVQAAARPNGQARVTPQAAQQGRFASRFIARQQAQAGNNNAAPFMRPAFVAPRRAWQRGMVAGFTPWYGPVFYPYAYSDIFNYTFWPGGYDDGYWDYAYDDFFDGVFFGQAGPPVDYAAGARPPEQPTYAAVQQICKQPGDGVTAWPITDIAQKVGVNGEQKALLDDLRRASTQAAQVFAASCPADGNFPQTPPGRLDAMSGRLEATLRAVDTVKPALDRFYDALNDEQKERFNALGPKGGADKTAAETTASGTPPNSCGDPKPGLTNLPIERIEDVVKPNDAQAAGLKALEDATSQAVAKLAAACPDDVPLTPPGRLDAMARRLSAMVDAAQTVKPALAQFYGSLSAEQKARFNAIGRSLASNQ